MKTTTIARSLQSAFTFAVAYGFAGSKFDPSNLLNVGLSTEEIPSERTLIPEGEQRFVVGKPKIESGEKDGKVWVKINFPMSLDEAGVLDELNVKELRTTYGFFLDLTDDGMIATGPNKNIRLGQMFQATGLEGEDVSINQVEGRQVIGSVKHRMSDRGNQYDEIVGLASVE
jgi:hypothetical protein